MKKIIITLALIVLLIPIRAQGSLIQNSYSLSYSLAVGEDVKLKTDDAGIVKWSSQNKKIASVSKSGKVKAINVGETVITANVNGKKIEYDIKVSKSIKAYVTGTYSSKGDTKDKVPYITKSKYNSLSNGYSYADAVKTIGVDGSLTSYVDDESNKTTTEVYTWTGEDGVANASVIFVNGKITEKDEMFLK